MFLLYFVILLSFFYSLKKNHEYYITNYCDNFEELYTRLVNNEPVVEDNLTIHPALSIDEIKMLDREVKKLQSDDSELICPDFLQFKNYLVVQIRFPSNKSLRGSLENTYEFNNWFKETSVNIANKLKALNLYVWDREAVFVTNIKEDTRKTEIVSNLASIYKDSCKWNMGVPKFKFSLVHRNRDLMKILFQRFNMAFNCGLSTLCIEYSENLDKKLAQKKRQAKIDFLRERSTPFNVQNEHILYGTLYSGRFSTENLSYEMYKIPVTYKTKLR